MAKQLVTESAEELVYRAEEDIIAVEELLGGVFYPADRKYNIIFFHAAQAVEKFLKAYIINNGKNIIKEHNLDYIQKIATETDISFAKIKNDCILLNNFLPNIKYNSRNPITKNNINKIIKSLDNICNFPPIKTMRVLFAKKYKYELVSEITTKPATRQRQKKEHSGL